MPSVEGVYEVYLGVWADGELVKLYQAESVAIQVAPAIEIIDIIWE